ncbi:MAG TPA: LysR substrate-binding domain-containing protein [Trebonia sp.]|jgi:DNA-binding transcriptional LysR family regulator|nr:LysR substrate-binding domain-containing protein [Trebonia sp.]
MEIALRHLTCFVAVAQERTMSRAAQRLHLSQPAVSKTLSELERMAGRQLVERGRAGTQLTPAGEEFLKHAAEVTRAVDAAASALSRSGTGPLAAVRVAVLHTVPGLLLARGLAQLHDRRPGARVIVRTAHNPELLAALTSGEADFAVGRMAEPHMMRGISFELLYAESLAVVVRPGHPLLLGGTRPLSAHDLLGYPLVVPEAGTAPRLHAEAIFAAAGVGLPLGCTQTQSSSMARALALTSDAVWITPRHAVQLDLDKNWLAPLDVAVPAAAEPVGLLSRSGLPASELAGQLMAILRALA